MGAVKKCKYKIYCINFELSSSEVERVARVVVV